MLPLGCSIPHTASMMKIHGPIGIGSSIHQHCERHLSGIDQVEFNQMLTY